MEKVQQKGRLHIRRHCFQIYKMFLQSHHQPYWNLLLEFLLKCSALESILLMIYAQNSVVQLMQEELNPYAQQRKKKENQVPLACVFFLF